MNKAYFNCSQIVQVFRTIKGGLFGLYRQIGYCSAYSTLYKKNRPGVLFVIFPYISFICGTIAKLDIKGN